VSNRSDPREEPAKPTRLRRPAEPQRPNTLPDDLLFRSDEEAARRLALKSLSAARAAERRLTDPFDPDALHELRVSVRRLRSLLRAYRLQLENVVVAKDRKRLRSIQLATGAGRESDVALQWLRKQHSELAAEHLAGLNWLSTVLLERRRKCAEDLNGELRAKFRRTARGLEDRLAIMRSERNLLVDQPEVRFARTLADLTEAHATELSTNFGRIASLDHPEQLHRARIAGKRLRYLLEPIRAYTSGAQSIVARSKKLQDVLGNLNDVYVLMREIDQSFETSMRQNAERVRVSLRAGDLDRARGEASVREWAGFIELYARLELERRELIGRVRDHWLGGELDSLVADARNVAQELRLLDERADR